MKRICVAFGTRPEAIKLAPVIKALRRRPDVTVTVVTTGQHRELLDQALAAFGLVGDVSLDVMSPRQTLAGLSGRMVPAFDEVIDQHRPDVVIVQGDTTSAFACALAAFYRRVPVAHVEAGLRTDDLLNPFPEEANRRLLSVVATWHFAPTVRARERLLAEGVAASSVYTTGNTIVDALQQIRDSDAYRSAQVNAASNGVKQILVTLHRRESWGVPLEGMCGALRAIADRHADVRVVFPVHLNPRVQDSVSAILRGHDRIALLPPVGYLDFLSMIERSWVVLTDSGGIQEEAPVFGTPVLVLRDTTERPEAVESGVAELVGTSEGAIVSAVERLLCTPGARDAMARAVSPFGDGRASERIADVLTA